MVQSWEGLKYCSILAMYGHWQLSRNMPHHFSQFGHCYKWLQWCTSSRSPFSCASKLAGGVEWEEEEWGGQRGGWIEARKGAVVAPAVLPISHPPFPVLIHSPEFTRTYASKITAVGSNTHASGGSLSLGKGTNVSLARGDFCDCRVAWLQQWGLFDRTGLLFKLNFIPLY